MKYIALALLLVSSAACADTSAQANDTQKGASGQTSGTTLDGPRPNGNVAQSNILPNVVKMAGAPAEFLSASQYQPQPIQTSGPTPLYSLSHP